MAHFERGPERESLDAVIGSVARAYGFVGAAVALPRKATDDIADEDRPAGLVRALLARLTPQKGITTISPTGVSVTAGPAGNVQAWAVAKQGQGSAIVFAIQSPRHSLAQAFVVKAALSTAESAGFTDLTVLVSSVGDQESRRRYAHELANFFKRRAKDLPEELKAEAIANPAKAAATLTALGGALADALPRPIDHLSEASRKVMLETIALLESLGIAYELAPRLPAGGVKREIVFAIQGTDPRGNRSTIASGGRTDLDVKGEAPAIGITVSMPALIDARAATGSPTPACFVVHVGEAAKVKAFGLLDALWRSHVALGHALLADTIQKQLTEANTSGAKYLAIVGQREALDGTVILKNVATQLQETVPAKRAIDKIARVRA